MDSAIYYIISVLALVLCRSEADLVRASRGRFGAERALSSRKHICLAVGNLIAEK